MDGVRFGRIDLVAFDASGRIIGATRSMTADAKALTIPPATYGFVATITDQ